MKWYYIMTKAFGTVFILIIILFIPHANADHWGKPKINGPGPWNENLVISITDPNKQTLFNSKKVLVKQAGVANFVLINNIPRLYFQWLPTSKDLEENFDHIAFMDYKNGWSSPKIISIPFSGKPHQYPVDPTVVSLKNGKFRLYFTTVDKKERTFIASAISDDGVNFSLEEGKRFRDKKLNLKDSAVVFYKGLWHIISPSHKSDGQGFYGVSKDGINFERKNNVKVNTRGDWLGNLTIIDEKVFFFGTGFLASTLDFINWKLESNLSAADPAVILYDNKGFLVSTSRN